MPDNNQTTALRLEHGPLLIAVLSDTHGVLDARIAAIVSRCDVAMHAGDIGGADVLRALQPRTGVVVAVRGNNDTPRAWPEGQHGILHSLPDEATVELPWGSIVMTHGHRVSPAATRHARLRRRHPQARVVIYGHSHRLVTDCLALPWVLNSGAAGRARTFGGPSCLVLHVNGDNWSVETHRFPT